MKSLFFSLWTKICQILYHFRKSKSVFLQTFHQSSVHIWHQYSVPSNITPLHFFSSKIIYFGQKQPIKVQIFEIFECSGSIFVKFLMLILNWQVNSSSNFASFFIVMTHNFSVNCNLKNFLLWIKEPNKSPNF